MSTSDAGDKSPGPPPLDLDKLGQIVDEIMAWSNKAGECCGTENLFARRFKLLKELGRGGFGIVYRATDEDAPATASDGQRKPIALKVLSLPPDLETSGVQRPVSSEKWDSIKKLIAELAIQEDASDIVGCVPMKSCNAPASQDDLDAMLAFVQENPIWFSMPVAKCNLAAYLESKGGQLSIDEAVDIMLRVAEALQGLHSYGLEGGIIHRDLKPRNILLMHDNKPVVADYGLSVRGFDQQITGNPTSGTVVYMSPEQLEGRALTAASDIWSWGVIFYQLVSGKLPFGGPHLTEYIRKSRFPSLSQWAPTCPEYLVDMVDRCLRKEGKREFDSFGHVIAELDRGSVASANYAPPLIETSKVTRKTNVKDVGIDDLHHTSRWLEYERYDETWSRLEAFVADPRPFVWWGVVGEGGTGKSRLGLELIDHVKNPAPEAVAFRLSPRGA